MKTILSLIGLATVVVGGIFGKKAYDKYQLKKGVDEANNNTSSGDGTNSNNNGTNITPTLPPTPAELAAQKAAALLKHQKYIALRNLLLSNAKLIESDIKLSDMPDGGEGNPEETVNNNLQVTFDTQKTNPLLVGIIPSYILLRDKPLHLHSFYYKTYKTLKANLVAKDQDISDAMADEEATQLQITTLNNERNTIVTAINTNKTNAETEYNLIKTKIILPNNLILQIREMLGITFSFKNTPVKVTVSPGGNASFDGIGKNSDIY